MTIGKLISRLIEIEVELRRPGASAGPGFFKKEKEELTIRKEELIKQIDRELS